MTRLSTPGPERPTPPTTTDAGTPDFTHTTDQDTWPRTSHGLSRSRVLFAMGPRPYRVRRGGVDRLFRDSWARGLGLRGGHDGSGVVGGGCLAAGVSKGLGDSVTSAVKDAYASLRSLLSKRFGSGRAEQVVDEHGQDPDTYDKRWRKVIRESGAAEDPQFLAAARKLLDSPIRPEREWEVPDPRRGRGDRDHR